MEAPSTNLISLGFAMLPLLALFDRWKKRVSAKRPRQPSTLKQD